MWFRKKMTIVCGSLVVGCCFVFHAMICSFVWELFFGSGGGGGRHRDKRSMESDGGLST